MRLSPLVGLTLLIAAFASSAQAAGFGCSASAGRVSVLGAAALEPVTAGGPGDCSAETSTLTGPAAGLPAPVSVGAVVAATEVYSTAKAVVSSGGVADLKVLSLPTLPVTLPEVPDAVKQAVAGLNIKVDLRAVKTAIPVLPTDLLTNFPISTLLGPVLDPLGLNAAQNAVNEAKNIANAATNAANGAVNALRAAIPDEVPVDVNALLGLLKLPSLELLHIKAAMAYAAGSCQTDAPAISGSSTIAGISILGQSVDLGQGIDRSVSLNLDLSKTGLSLAALNLDASQAQLINASGVTTVLNGALATANQTIATALAGLQLPTALAQIKITPGEETKSGDSLTRRALRVQVSILGTSIVDATVGEATVSSAGVDCSAPVTDPGTPTGATFECTTRRLVLVDVLERKGRVKLFGVADPALVGKTVKIVFEASGRTVARAKVKKDGTFDTTAAMPSRAVRDTNDARYTAVLGKEESINLKLRRRMVLDSISSSKGKVTIAGRVIPPLGKPLRMITLTRRVSCKDEKVVTRFKPRANGSFRITVKAPRGVGTAVYRMTTKVRNSSTGNGTFETYTLPRAVELQR